MTSPLTRTTGDVDAQLKRFAVVVILGTIMSILDTTIVTVAIDTLGRDFHSPLSSIQWVATGYLLALSLVIPLSGWAVERYGAKQMWMLSLTLFLAGSLLCGAAWSTTSLVVFRVLQGLGGGMIMPIGMTILAREAGPQRMGRVMTLIGVPALMAPVLGPVIGGLIVDNLSWRWIFYVNAPVGALALALAWRLLPAERGQRGQRLDALGVLLVSPGLAALVYGLSEAGNSGGVTEPQVLVAIAVGLVLVAAFVRHALHTPHALMDVRLYRDRTFSVASIATFVVGAVLFGAMFLLPLYYQVIRGQSALDAGLLMAPQGIGAMIGMPIAGRVVDRIGAGRVVPFGVVLVVLGTAAYTQVGLHTSEMLLAGSLFVRGLGMGVVMMPTMSAAYHTLSRAVVPRATTMINIVQRVGGSVGTALVAVVLQRRIAAVAPQAGGSALGTAPSGAAHDRLAPVMSGAFGHTFWWVLGLTALTLIPTLLLPRRPPVAPEPAAVREESELAAVDAVGAGAATAGLDVEPSAV